MNEKDETKSVVTKITTAIDNLEEAIRLESKIADRISEDTLEVIGELISDIRETLDSVTDFRMDELDAVMCSVDKWFEEGDPRLKNNPATRAADAREIALRAIEGETRKFKYFSDHLHTIDGGKTLFNIEEM